jgi:hypothetical protein
MVIYAWILLGASGAAAIFDPKIESRLSLLVFIPLYGRVIGWW